MGKIRGFNVLCLFFVTLLCNEVRTQDKCAVGCRSETTAGTPSFVTGQTYTYSVEGSVSVLLSSAERQETSLKASGVFAVTALGDCAHVLRVKNLQISGPNGKKYGRPAGIEKPIRFTLQDGAVGPEICSEAGDNQRSLNFKRALVSLLQNSGKSGQEIDVFGVCPTEVSTAGGGVYLRSRDLNRCAHRERGKHDLITAVYNPHSEIKASQLLQSTYNTETKLKGSAVEKVVATEEYLYRPFSVGQNGAKARVVTKLSLTGQAAGADTGKFTDTKSILFENPHPTVVEHSNVPNVLLALKSAAQSLEANTGSKSAGIFANLVRVLRVTSKADLLNIYGQIKAGGAVKNNDLAKKVFLDGLIRSGTGESIAATLQLIQSKELSTLEQRLVFLSLSNVRHATEESLTAAAKILDTADLPREVYLGVGALAGAYCREHICHGEASQSAGINALSKKLAAKLNGCKPANRKDEDTVVAVLKGIRSIRHLENELVDKLAHCVSDHHVKNRIKVAALEAFTADPCTPKLKKVAIDTLKNRQLDSEVRIKAYLALIECPCGKVANELKTLLDTEPVYQVGRFIVSSLRNIRASANPGRESARQHFALIRTPNKFPIDDRKFSHNQEFSYNVDAIGLGATVEKNVIFSQDSFLPRSVNLNLTTEVFGHDINIIEVGVRQGNLDRLVEHYFGPKGLLKAHKPQEIYDRIVSEYKKLKQTTTGQFEKRTKRAVQQEIAAFSKHVKQELSGFDGDLDLDVFVKLFGTDAIFLSFGDEQSLTFSGIVDKIFEQLESGMDKAKHFNDEVRAHLLFLDAELTYPTSIGIPLKLDLVGSTTTKLGLGGSIDIRQIMQDPKNAKLDIKFIPSANIEIAGSLIADADLVSTGLKVVSNLHTSTGGHLVAKILENGKGFDLQLALPVDKQEIIAVTNDIVFATQEKGQQESEVTLKFDVDRKDYSGCFDQLSSALGLVLCADFNIPWAAGTNTGASLQRLAAKYPLTGPSRIAIRLDKADLKGYHIKALFNDKDPRRQLFEFVIDAEGTRSNRKTALNGELINKDEQKSVSVALVSPYKNADAKVAFINSGNEKSLAALFHNGNDEYSGKLGFAVSGDQSRSVFTPFFEIRTPNSSPKSFDIEGTIISEPSSGGRKFNFNGVSLVIPNSEKIRVDGFVAQEAQGLSTDLKLSTGRQQGTLKAKLVPIQNGAKIDAEFHNTLNPAIDFLVKYEGLSKEGHVQNDLVLVLGPDSSSSINKLTINQNLKYDTKSAQEFDIISKNKVSYPAAQLQFEANGEFNPKKVNLEVEGKHASSQAGFQIEARRSTKAPGDYQVKAKADFNGKGFEFFSKRDLDGEDRSNIQNILNLKPGGKYELSGVVNHRVKDKDINVGVVGHLKIDGKNQDYSVDVGLVANHGLYSSHAKISVGSTEYLDYISKVNRGANPNGSLKLLIKEYVNANGQFKLNGNDGKGNALLLVDFIRLKRKFKADSTFVIREPQYNANVDLYLDFERDNNNKISFTTATKVKGENFDSKNSAVFAGKKTELNLKVDSTGTWPVGKCQTLAELVLPSERVLTFKLDRDLTKKDEIYNGKVNVLITDAPRRGGQASKVEYKAQLSNTDLRKYHINYVGALEVALTNGKNLNTALTFKNLPNGDRLNFEAKVDATGSLLNKPASFLTTLDYKVTDSFYDSKYRIKSSIGSDISFDATGKNAFTASSDDIDKKFLNQFQIQVSLPFDQAHDIRITSSDEFLIPADVTKQYQFATSKAIQVNAETYKFESNVKAGHGSGYSKVKVIVPHQDPLAVEGNYKYAKSGEGGSASSEVKVTYGKGKSAGLALEGQRKRAGEVTGHIRATLPENEKLKVLDVKINYKTNDGRSHTTQIVADADGKAYKIESQVDVSKNAPLVDIKFEYPENKNSRFFAKANLISDHKVKGEVKIVNIKDFNLVASIDGVTESADNFNIKVDVDSAKLNLNKVHLDISSKPAKSGRRIQFNAKSGEQNLLSGSTSYLSKEEGTKSIIEGSGTVKLRDEQKTATFKYIRDILSEGPEHGVQIFLNVALGDKSFVVEHRATNVELKLSSVYCEEKKQCAHADFSSKLNTNSPGQIQHHLTIGLDLRKLGLSPEFGLQATTEAGEGRFPQFLIDVHLNQEQTKYNLHAYSQPKKGAFPAGITLTLPQRVISLESTFNYPEGQILPFPLNGEIALYLNKNAQRNQKAALRLHADYKYEAGKSYSYVAELGLSHPSIGKEALLKLKNEFQRPQDTSLTAFSTLTLSHPFFGRDKEVVARVDASPQRVKIEFRTPNVEVLNIEGNFRMDKEIQSTDFYIVILQGKPVQLHAKATGYKNFEFTSGYKDQPSNKLSVTAQLEPEKRAGFSVDILLPNEKKNIIHAALVIEGDQIKPEYGASGANLKYFGNAVSTDLKNLGQRLKQLSSQTSAIHQRDIEKATEGLKKISDYYKTEAIKIRDELINDKTLQELNQLIKNVVQSVAKVASEIIEHTTAIIDKSTSFLKENYAKIAKVYQEKILPELTELYNTYLDIVTKMFDTFLSFIGHYIALVNDFVEKHKGEFKELTTAFTEIFRDLSRIFVTRMREVRAGLANMYAAMSEQLQELPIVSDIKKKLEEFRIPEEALRVLGEFNNAVMNVLPTEETKKLADACYNYIVKKLKQETVDDVKELTAILEKLSSAVTSVLKYVRGQMQEHGLQGLLTFNIVPLLPNQVQSVPFFGGVSFSPLNYFVNQEFPSVRDFFRAYRPRSINLLNELPPTELRGTIVNGQHIFTLDGRHLTFPGNCRYVAAHDSLDGNFTIALTLQAGLAKAITVLDKTGSVVEYKENGQLWVNGANHGFPLINENFQAWREPSGFVGIYTTYGALVRCTSDLKICTFKISGYYLGRLRGLLGDGNNEPFDDFRLPAGKISASEGEFGNAYRLQSSCALVKTVDHKHQHGHDAHTKVPQCDSYFSSSSSLRMCFDAIDVSPYRQACEHAVSSNAANADDEACGIAYAYAMECRANLVFVRAPEACGKCGDKKIGDAYTATAPNQQADIIVFVETTKNTESVYRDLVVPVISHVTDELKNKKIDDVKVYLVGASPTMPYAILYDNDGSKLKGKITFKDESRYATATVPVKTGYEKIDEPLQKIAEAAQKAHLELGVTNLVQAYTQLIDLPLRPNAAITIISVLGDSCKQTTLPIQNFGSFLTWNFLRTTGIVNHIIAPTPNLTFGTQSAQVIGFNSDTVYVVGDKKRAGGGEELRRTLDYGSDVCIDYAQKTYGNVYSSSNFQSTAAGARKQFIQQTARSVVDSIVGFRTVRSCTCQLTTGLFPQTTCTVDSRKHVATRRR